MKKISLLTALMLSSSMVYAGWNRYEFDSTKGGYKTPPEYSCLEMFCEHDCVENTETGEGECCPAPVEGTSCVSDTKNEKGCILSLKKTCPSNQYCNKNTEKCEHVPSCPDCQDFDRDLGKCVSVNGTFDACYNCVNGEKQLKDPTKRFVYNDICVECLKDTDCYDNKICNLQSKTCLSESQKCLGKIERCGDDALGFMFEGQLYCYNTHEEFTRRCREAIPGRTSCSNNHGCFYASNYYNEDYSGNCHWGYFDYTDAQNWCKGKGGKTVSKAEMEKIWSEFKKCTPSFGKHNESCYWTNTTACKTRNGNYNNARPDGYINAGGGFCKMD